eukprot:gene9818-13211_t
MSPEKKVFADTLTYPTEFNMKIIGLNDKTFLEDTIKTISICLNKPPISMKVSTKVTTGGNYLSISITPVVESSDDIYKVYSEISKDSRVKFMI